MVTRVRILILLCLCLNATSVLQAQMPPASTIAFVNIDKLLESPRLERLRKLQDEVRESVEKNEASLKQLTADIEALEQELQDPQLDSAKLPELTRRYIHKSRDMRLRVGPEYAAAKGRAVWRLVPLYRELDAVVKSIAVKKNIALVLYRGVDGRMLSTATKEAIHDPISYLDPTLDITDQVIEQLGGGASRAPEK